MDHTDMVPLEEVSLLVMFVGSHQVTPQTNKRLHNQIYFLQW